MKLFQLLFYQPVWLTLLGLLTINPHVIKVRTPKHSLVIQDHQFLMVEIHFSCYFLNPFVNSLFKTAYSVTMIIMLKSFAFLT